MAPPNIHPLTALQIEERLDKYLDHVLSSRRTATSVANRLATCERHQQDWALHWVEIVAHCHAELGYQFAHHAVTAFEHLKETEGLEAWLILAMDTYDKQGLHSAIAVLTDVAKFAQTQQSSGLALTEIDRVLTTFLAGLSGRSLKLEGAEKIYTDTETLFLPPRLTRFPNRDDNFRLYKAMAVHLWAQTRFGTWGQRVSEEVKHFPQPDKACRLFQVLERLRLDACIARELPGVHRDLNQLAASLGEVRIPPGWETIAEWLARPAATVQDSYELLPQIYSCEVPPPLCYQGILWPDRVEEIIAWRLAREKELFRIALAKLAEEHRESSAKLEKLELNWPDFMVQQVPDESQPNGFQFELLLEGRPINPPDQVKSLMDSIIQDLGKIPEDYLVPAGDGGYKILETSEERDPAATVWQGVYHEEGAFFYDEWDYKRKHYRKHWCVLRELEVLPQSEQFVTATLQRYRGLVKQLRRTFEALRGENKLLKAQPNGEDIDLDALVRAYGEAKHGLEMTNRLFTKWQKEERQIAVMFMIDMSGSTKGWINDAQREALVLLCEALETLGDRYAIYGFSGTTRKRCEIYRVKTFEESYTLLVQQRISGIQPQDYTRMGVAIRHLTQLLNTVEAKIKLLITLSDGRPDDFADNYRGPYGIEDTRQALIEAKRQGIHPFCITLDTQAKDYLSHMYGAVNYIVIDEVRKLPLKVADIYRKLTT